MKRITIIIFIFLSLSFKTFAQADLDISEIKQVKIYAVEWNIKSRLAFTIKNFKARYHHYFQNDGSDLDTMFSDYKECLEKLSSQKSISSDSAYPDYIRDYVELHFKKGKTIELYFDIHGNYYFKDKWYSRNDGLYYALFKYFSDILIPQNILYQAKRNYKDRLWHNE